MIFIPSKKSNLIDRPGGDEDWEDGLVELQDSEVTEVPSIPSSGERTRDLGSIGDEVCKGGHTARRDTKDPESPSWVWAFAYKRIFISKYEIIRLKVLKRKSMRFWKTRKCVCEKIQIHEKLLAGFTYRTPKINIFILVPKLWVSCPAVKFAGPVPPICCLDSDVVLQHLARDDCLSL